jgi:shikimate dehydrogenase
MSAPLFYTLDDLHNWDQFATSLQPPARLAVIGDPIAHSRSPQLHNPALKARGIDAQYIRVLVSPGQVAEALQCFAKQDFLGVNCTIPHKFEALEAMDVLDPLALQLGAVNTVAIRDGKLHGYNSDGPGFLNSLREAFGRELKGLRVLLLGAGGGAGQAVALQCALAGCNSLALVNRTLSKIEPLAKECREVAPGLPVTLVPWTEETLAVAVAEADLIINATPRGMKAEDSPLFASTLLRPEHHVYDMVYRSSGQTPLIAAAQQQGAKTCDGLALLLHQGAISFEHWFGRPVPLQAMRLGLQG